MKYDFTSIIDRHGKDAKAVDGLGHGFAPPAPKEGFDSIPMWVADMNFATVPTIPQAIVERAMHPTYGYFEETAEYHDSIIRWHEKRNGVTGLTKEHIGYENGVIGAVISAVSALCPQGGNVLVHSPTYIGFTVALKTGGYNIVNSPLIQDENGVWRMDFEDMEKKIVMNKMFTTCGITKCPISDFLKEVWPFIVCLIVVLLLCTFFPVIVTIVPDLIYGGI